jgi:HEPN domain-containing protein
MESHDAGAVRLSVTEAYLSKAREMLESGEHSLAEGRWNAACLAAVYSNISSVQAVLAMSSLSISAETDDQEALRMIERSVSALNAVTRRRIARLLRDRDDVGRAAELVTQTQARHRIDAARRVLEWATKSRLSSHRTP